MDALTALAASKLDQLTDYFDRLACDLARDGMEMTGADLAHASVVIRHLAVHGLTTPGMLVRMLEADPADILAITQEQCPGEVV